MATSSSLVQTADAKQGLILGLPLEMLYRVLSYLALRDIRTLSSVCNYLFSICSSPLAYEHLVVDKRIRVKKVLRKGDMHYFVRTRSITCLECLPMGVENIINTKFVNFPKLESIDLIDSPIPLKYMVEMPDEILRIQSVKLCISVPYIFPGSGFWSCEQRQQLKMALIGFLHRMLQTNTLTALSIMFILDDSICNIQTNYMYEDLKLDLLLMPKRVEIENLALFNFEITNPSLIFSKFHSIQAFRLAQQESSLANFILPISFSLPVSSESPPPTLHRSLCIDPSAMRPEYKVSATLGVESSHQAFYSINWIPETLISCIDYTALAFLDLSRSTPPLSVNLDFKSLPNLQGLNIFQQSTFLLYILEHVQAFQNVLFPKLVELNVAGIECSQVFDRIPKEILTTFFSQLTRLKSLTLTPCMMLTQYNLAEGKENLDFSQPSKQLKFDAYCLCVHKLFAFCPFLSFLRITDESLVKCQLCVEEYSKLILTRQPSHKDVFITKLSLHYTQGIIRNFGTLLLKEISSFQLPYLTHLCVHSNRNIPVYVLFDFLKLSPNTEVLSFDCSIVVTPKFCEGLYFLDSLKSLFLITESISDVNALTIAISDLKYISTVWLHFTHLSAKQAKEIKNRIVQIREFTHLKVNYSNRQSPLADTMYLKILSHLYRRSGLLWTNYY